MPELKVIIERQDDKENITYQGLGLTPESAVGYLECFKMFLLEKVKDKHGTKFTDGKPLTVLVDGKPVAFTRDATRFTTEMKSREFGFIRKKLKMSVKNLAKLLEIPESAVKNYEAGNKFHLSIPETVGRHLRVLYQMRYPNK